MGVAISEETGWSGGGSVGDYRLPTRRKSLRERAGREARRIASAGAGLLMLTVPGLWIPGIYRLHNALKGKTSIDREETEAYEPSLEIEKDKRVFVRYKNPQTNQWYRFAVSPGMLESDAMPVHRGLLEAALDKEPDVKRGILTGMDRRRQLEELNTAEYYDNSRTPIMASVNFDALGPNMDKFFNNFILTSNTALKEKIKQEGRKQLTPEELEEEKWKLKEKLEKDSMARGAFTDGLLKHMERRSLDIASEGKVLPSAGPLEAEYFADPDVTADAAKKGFAPGARGEHVNAPGVVLQNRIKDNMILIKNVTTPPKALNCTIKIPRIDERGNKIGSHDTVVIRNGEVAMAIQGEGGRSRIANMADIMEGLKRPARSGMSGAMRERRGRSGMSGAAQDATRKDPAEQPARSTAAPASATPHVSSGRIGDISPSITPGSSGSKAGGRGAGS